MDGFEANVGVIILAATNRPQQGPIEHFRPVVAARMITPTLASKPSISTSNWLSVCSRLSLTGPRCTPRSRPMASNSSMKIMQGAWDLACSNRSRTRARYAHEHLDEFAAAEGEEGHAGLARHGPRRRVLPVPGGPTKSTPLGILAPNAV